MAAGLGFKDFTTGEVLTAADVDGYLMQGVWVFASAAARDAAVTSPQEGNFAYLKDTNVTTYYTGSAWANLDTTGMTNPMTTTGDTIYSSSGSTPARLGIGSTGQVLTVSGGLPSWATPAGGGGMTFIQRSTFSNVANTGTTFDNVFTSSYETYFINIENIFSASAGDDLQMQLRYAGPTTQASAYYMANYYANYTATSMSFQGSNNAAQWTLSDNSGDTNDRLAAQLYVNQVGNTSERALINGAMINSNKITAEIFAGNAYTAQLYTGFILKSSSANISGTITIFGVNKS